MMGSANGPSEQSTMSQCSMYEYAMRIWKPEMVVQRSGEVMSSLKTVWLI